MLSARHSNPQKLAKVELLLWKRYAVSYSCSRVNQQVLEFYVSQRISKRGGHLTTQAVIQVSSIKLSFFFSEPAEQDVFSEAPAEH